MRTRTYKVTGLFIGPVSVKGKVTLYYLELGTLVFQINVGPKLINFGPFFQRSQLISNVPFIISLKTPMPMLNTQLLEKLWLNRDPTLIRNTRLCNCYLATVTICVLTSTWLT